MEVQSVLFVQGAGGMREPDGSGQLADYLARELGSGYRVVAPEMPDPDNPRYSSWRDRIEEVLATLDGEVILVGHSFGGSVLLKYLAEGSCRRALGGLFLVAVPYWKREAFEEFALPDDFASKLPALEIFLYHSQDDPEVPFAQHLRYERELPNATARPLPGVEHSFTRGLPELVLDIESSRR